MRTALPGLPPFWKMQCSGREKPRTLKFSLTECDREFTQGQRQRARPWQTHYFQRHCWNQESACGIRPPSPRLGDAISGHAGLRWQEPGRWEHIVTGEGMGRWTKHIPSHSRLGLSTLPRGQAFKEQLPRLQAASCCSAEIHWGLPYALRVSAGKGAVVTGRPLLPGLVRALWDLGPGTVAKEVQQSHGATSPKRKLPFIGN